MKQDQTRPNKRAQNNTGRKIAMAHLDNGTSSSSQDDSSQIFLWVNTDFLRRAKSK